MVRSGRVAARAARPAAMRDDLLEQALLGLRYARNPRATARLRAIESGAVRPCRARPRSARRRARRAGMARCGSAIGRRRRADRDGRRLDGEPSTRPDRTATVDGRARRLRPAWRRAFDGDHTERPAVAAHLRQPSGGDEPDDQHPARRHPRQRIGLVWGGPTSARTSAAAPGSPAPGNAQTFGSINDGLDTIDNNSELNAVLNNAVARVKVVRIINYCGGSGTNIIGCAWIGGEGMALVRYGDESVRGAALGARVRPQRRASATTRTVATSCTSACAAPATG